MAVNVLGQTVQLALSNTQLQDFTQNLKSGDQLRGRVVEVLQDSKAVVNFRGFAVLSELSPALFQSVQKGDILQVQVTGLPPQTARGSVSSQGEPQPVSLRLVALLGQQASSAAATTNHADIQGQRAVQTQARLESAVRQAGLPVNESTLAVARSLNQAGLPVTGSQVRAVLDALTQLSPAKAPVAIPGTNVSVQGLQSLPPQVQQVVQSAQTLLTALSLGLNNTQNHLQIQQGLRTIQNLAANTTPRNPQAAPNTALPQGNTPSVPQTQPNSATAAPQANVQKGTTPPPATPPPAATPGPAPNNSAPAPQVSSIPTPPGSPTPPATPAPAVPQPAASTGQPAPPAPSPSLNQAAQQVQHAIQALQQNPSLPVQGLTAALSNLGKAVQTSPAGFEPVAQTTVASQPALAAEPAIPVSVQQSQNVPRVHQWLFEQTAQLVQQQLAPSQENPVFNSGLMKGLETLRAVLSSPLESRPAEWATQIQNLAADKGLQVPTRQVLEHALQNLRLIQDSFANVPLSRPLTDAASLSTALQLRGFEVQSDPLAAAGRQTVIDSLVFLQARNLPLTPSIARPVVQAFAQGDTLGQRLEGLLLSANSLLASNPGPAALPADLSRSLEALRAFLQEYGVKAGDPQLSAKVRDFVHHSGLNLENRLAAAAKSDNPSAAVPQPGQDLKATLLNLQNQLRVALADSEVAGKEHFSRMVGMEREATQSLSALTTLQLAAAPVAHHDTFAVQIPLWFGSQLENGHLSVYWKKNSDRQLSEKDPVNLVFVLNTRGLGEVKVTLELYKDRCLCSVQVQDEATRAFFAPFMDDLKAGFSDNTPFEMQRLDLGVSEANASGGAGELSEPVRGDANLDLSA